MSVSIDNRISTLHANLAVNSHVSIAQNELRQIRRDQYFPRYKCEDKARALFFELGLVDETGKIDRYLVHLAEIPLNQDERLRVNACLTKVLNIVNHRVGISFNAKDILADFLTPSQANDILPELFNHLEIVGSAVNQCLGLSFFKRFTEDLFKFAFAEKDAGFIQVLLKNVFTPEFESHLNQRFNRKLADLDLRLSTHTPLQHGQAIACIQNAFDKMMSIMIAKMPLLEGDKEKERRHELLNLLKSRLAVLDWNWLSIEDPQFYYHLIKNLAFNKLSLITKDGENFGILNLGNMTEFVVDFVFVINLQRYEMFPAVKIPCVSLLNPATDNQPIYPGGENWVQAMTDTLFGCVRPDINKATEDDFKMLQCRKTKGEINAVPGSEHALLKIVREQSVNCRNKVVKKILRNHPQLLHKPENNFPYFLAQMMKDAVETHFDKDPMSAIALTINTCESLHGQVSYEEMEIFVREMQNYWKGHYFEQHPLYAIARVFTEIHILESHNTLVRKLSLVKLCAFLHCQAPAQDNKNAPIVVYPRKNETQACLEISIRGNGKSYSLILDVQSPHTLLLDTLKYYQIAKSKDTLESIESVIECFLPKTGFGGAWSTPMLDDLRFFDHNLEFFEKAAASSLITQQPLFGLFLLFATQAQIGDNIPLQSVFIQLPLLLNKVSKHKDFVFDHLIKFTNDPILIDALKKMKAFIENNKFASEYSLIDKWIELLSQNASTLPLAKQCFVETLHQSTTAKKEKRSDVLFKLYEQSKKIEAGFAIQILQFIQEKSYTTPRKLLELFDDILSLEFTSPQDVSRLERIAEHLIQLLKRDKSTHKEDLEALKTLLAKLAFISPRAEVMIQKLQTPAYAFDEKEVVSRHELIKQHVDAIESLIATDYEMATESLYDLAQVIRSVSPDKILSIVEKIVARCLVDNNLPLAQVLLRHEILHNYFMVDPEIFFNAILIFLDKLENSSLVGKEEARTLILEKVLKAFINNQSPRLSLETMQRLVGKCMGIFHDPCYLLKPIPESFIRTFTQAFTTLFFALNAKNAHLDCVRLYHAIYIYDAGNSNISMKALHVCESLEQLLATSHFTNEVELIADTIISPIIKFSSETNRIKVLKLLISLFENVAGTSQKFAYLERLAKMGSLDQVEILDILFPFFTKLASADQDAEALRAIRYFSGTVSSEDFPDSKHFHGFIGKLIRGGQWTWALEALAINPFVWANPSFQTKQIEYATRVLQKTSEQEFLSLVELKQSFRIIERNSLSDTGLIASFYEKCADAIDEVLAHQLISIFKKQLLKANILSTYQFEKTIFIVLKALKFLPGTEVEQFLNDEVFLSDCRQNASPQVCFEVYKLIWKALLHVIKTSKATDKLRLHKELNSYFETWVKRLGIVSETNIQEARVELIEYCLSLNEPEMLCRSLEHFAVFGAHMAAAPHLKERFNKIIRILYARMIKLSEEDAASMSLKMIVEEISRSDIPPLSQSKCLKFCYTGDSQATGLTIIHNCLAIKTFSREEVSTLKTYNFYHYLLHSIENLNPENLATFELILNNPRLRLFVDRNELAILESSLAYYYCAQAESNGIRDLVKTQKSIEYLYSKLGGIARVNHKDHFKHFAESFFDYFFEKKEDTYLNKFSETIKQSENGAETLLALTHAMGTLIFKHFWENCDEARTATLINTFNDLLIEGLPKRRPITETELKQIKMWVLLQSSSERLAITQLSQQFVATLLTVLKNYPQDLFELRFLHSLMMRETASDYMKEHPNEMKRCFKNAGLMVDDLKDATNPRQLYEDNKHCVRLAIALPFKDAKEKREELKVTINCAYHSIKSLPEQEQNAAIDELLPLWVEGIGSDDEILYATLITYFPENHAFWINTLRKKIHFYLDLLLRGKSPLVHSMFFKIVLEALSGIVSFRVKNSQTTDLGNKKAENDLIMSLFKDIITLYDEFCSLASKLSLTPENKFEASEHYMRILTFLLKEVPKHIPTQDPEFVRGIFVNASHLLKQVPLTSNAIRAQHKHLESRILPSLRKEFEQRVSRK